MIKWNYIKELYLIESTNNHSPCFRTNDNLWGWLLSTSTLKQPEAGMLQKSHHFSSDFTANEGIGLIPVWQISYPTNFLVAHLDI